MKRFSTFFVLTTLMLWAFGQQNSHNKIQLLESRSNTQIVKMEMGDYEIKTKKIKNRKYQYLTASNAVSNLSKGDPEVLKMATSIIIPENGNIEIEVLSSRFEEFDNISLLPSKGNLYRNTNPDQVPYKFGEQYSKNEFFPEALVSKTEPYILRDYTGQSIQFYPFQTNPITKKLRVYSEITIKITHAPIVSSKSNKVAKEFKELYKNHFLNFSSTQNSKYTPVEEQGKMIIIANTAYMDAMQDFVNWKNTIGIPTEMFDIADIGNNQTSIKNFVSNYYTTNNDLVYLLLVGDAQHITPATIGGNHSDNIYSYLTGNDSYPEIFVGRFSAESLAHVQTQVQRTIAYEQNPQTGDWLNTAIGIASSEGPGYQNLYDYQDVRIIRDTLLNYHYTNVSELYEGSQGGLDAAGDPTSSMLTSELNAGAGIINYVGHGSETSWVTTGFSNTNINALTNIDKLPFIWSVACVNGAFVGRTCFAETWMRATHNNNPSGAIAIFASTINQSWDPPMAAQREMNDILTESYQNNIKRTFGGLSMNGCMKMIDLYGSDGSEMSDTWAIFGDPSLMVRTRTPLSMNVSHNDQILMQETSVDINCNIINANITLSVNNQIIGSGISNGNILTIDIEELTTTDSITVAVSAYNYIPYIGKISVIDFLYDNDAEIFSIIHPEEIYNCTGHEVAPKIILRNKGIENLTQVSIQYTLDNGTPVNTLWTGNLANMAKDTVSLPPFILTTGNFEFVASVLNPNNVPDDNTDNDSKSRNFQVADLPLSTDFTANTTEACNIPLSIAFSNQTINGLNYFWDFGDGSSSTEINPTHSYTEFGYYTVTLIASSGICGIDTVTKTNYIKIGLDPISSSETSITHCAPATAEFSVTGTGDIKWYADSTYTQLVHTGNDFTTPILDSPAKYYVRKELASPIQNVGKIDNSGSGGYFGSYSSTHFLIFDCSTPSTLISVKVYAESQKNRTIVLRDANEQVLATKIVSIPSGESRVQLNFDIPIGNNLQLVATGSPDLFRNNNNSANYPYEIDGLISIKESSASLPQYNAPGNYYYFYDWEIQESNCYSNTLLMNANILPPPIAAFSSDINGATVTFNNQSLYAESYLWSLGDGNSSTEPNPIHFYDATNTFTVKMWANGLCGIDSTEQQVATTTAAPIADFEASNTTINKAQTVTFTDLSQYVPTSWQWSFDGGSPIGSNEQNPIIRYFNAGVYSVSLTVTNSFGSNEITKTDYILVNDPTAINENKSNISSIHLFPNPIAGEEATLLFNSRSTGKISIRLFNQIGQLVKTLEDEKIFSDGNHKISLPLSNTTNGFYYIQIEAEGSVYNKKIIICK